MLRTYDLLARLPRNPLLVDVADNGIVHRRVGGLVHQCFMVHIAPRRYGSRLGSAI
jgi:hypothetical protein